MKTQYVCQNCGAFSQKWLGRCPACGMFDVMVEEAVERHSPVVSNRTAVLSDLRSTRTPRRPLGMPELDLVLGGGLVNGSLILLGGDPGIGKSTLMLQMADLVTHDQGSVLYVSGEESAEQVKLRAERLGITGQGIQMLAETEIATILATARAKPPALLIVDSIQTMYKSNMASAPGSVAQVRECGADLMKFAKETGTATVIIGHVTKYGAIAGPKTLEHIVDTVLYFEGDRDQQYRILRAIKNRFGSTNEIGIFEMTARGLQGVPNPSRLFISDSATSGSVIIAVLEGSRPLLVEVQALTSPTFFNYPQRVTTGFDQKRLALLLAVLERRAGVNAYGLDCFINAVGGIKVTEPSSDLGICLAVASSIQNKAISRGTLAVGELGLGGEIRPVYGIELRLREAEKMGLQMAIIPQSSVPAVNVKIATCGVRDIREAIAAAFGT